jgi:transposase
MPTAADAIDYKHLYEQEQLKVAALSHELSQLKKLLFGSRQERFIAEPAGPGTLIQGSLDLHADVIAASQITGTTKVSCQQSRTEVVTQRKEHPGRTKLPDHLRREVIVLEPAEDVRGMRRLGYEITEVLEYLPGELYVKRYLRPVYVQPTPGINTTFITASLPSRLLEKCMAGEGLLAQMVVDKYMDHLPIHRQLQRYQRAGVTISQSTSNDWMRNVLVSLTGLYELHKKQVLQSSYLHVDETTIRVLDENKKGTSHLGYYWLYHNSEQKLALFDYRKTRAREAVQEMLKDYRGYLQTDGYVVYEGFEKREDITLVGCMAHARRKFTEAINNDAGRAGYVLEKMQLLYAVERRIKEEGLTRDALMELRQTEAVPVLSHLKDWMLAQASEVLPKSPTGQAIAYSLSRWDKLCVYTTHARLQIDNNVAEREMRPIAVGRKGYLFAGSHDAAQRSAMIYSLFATCRLHNINPYHWLKDVLERMADYTTKNLHELLPHNWKAAKSSG